LVEVLLTLVLILCLAAASVFTFTALYRSANLDEGLDRFQSLIRFAQAEAASSGRKVRMQFEQSAIPQAGSSALNPELRAIRVTWEADLLNAPGVFQSLTNKGWSEESVNELVGVEKVQSILPAPTVPAAARPAAFPVIETGLETGEEEFAEMEFPAITFYPDGSSDPVEIVLASRNSDDGRRLAVRLGGQLGAVSSRTIIADEAGSGGLEESFEPGDSEAFQESASDQSPEDFTTAESRSSAGVGFSR